MHSLFLMADKIQGYKGKLEVEVAEEDRVISISQSNLGEMISFFKEYTQDAFGASEFTDMLSKLNNSTLSDIEEKCQKLSEIAAKYCNEASLEYEKCKNTVYIVYPGIAAIIGLFII